MPLHLPFNLLGRMEKIEEVALYIDVRLRPFSMMCGLDTSRWSWFAASGLLRNFPARPIDPVDEGSLPEKVAAYMGEGVIFCQCRETLRSLSALLSLTWADTSGIPASRLHVGTFGFWNINIWKKIFKNQCFLSSVIWIKIFNQYLMLSWLYCKSGNTL